MTTRSIKLTQQLKQSINEFLNHYKNHEGLGSLNFWYDEYGASLGFCKWLRSERPWGISQDNNIDLSEFDVFDRQDTDELEQTIQNFFELSETKALLSRFPLRKGFQNSITCFDPPEFIHLSPPSNQGIQIEIPSESASISIVASIMSNKLKDCQSLPLRKISLSSECEAISLSYSMGTSQEELESDLFSDDSWNLGLALNQVCQLGEKNWPLVCELIIKESALAAFPKCSQVIFYLRADYEHAFACLFDNDTQTVRLLGVDEKYDYM